VSGDTALPFIFGLAGSLRYRGAAIRIAPLGVAVHGQGAIPDLNASGQTAFADALSLHLSGRLANWPETWPALPAPVGSSDSPLPFALDYAGKADFTETAALELRRDDTRFAGRFRLPEVTAWIDAGSKGSPLPPLDGRLSAPAMEISGAHLQGVEIQINDPAVPEPVSK
jgi:hypothetical protein